jgi:hypothetical protein
MPRVRERGAGPACLRFDRVLCFETFMQERRTSPAGVMKYTDCEMR